MVTAIRQPPQTEDLDFVTTGNPNTGKAIAIYGIEGVGKTTFGVRAPNSIFLCAENGLTQYPRHPRLKDSGTWEGAMAGIQKLATKPHGFKWLVIDTWDWLDIACQKFICQRDKQPSIEDYEGGWGKGPPVLTKELMIMFNELDKLRAKGMWVLVLAHAHVKNHAPPDMHEKYDRYELAASKTAAAMLKQWCDALLFARFHATTMTTKQKRVIGISDGSRIAYASHSAAYDAKNRLGLPDVIPFSWEDFEVALKDAEAREASLRKDLLEKADRIGGEMGEKIRAEEARATTIERLEQLINRANIRLQEAAVAAKG